MVNSNIKVDFILFSSLVRYGDEGKGDGEQRVNYPAILDPLFSFVAYIVGSLGQEGLDHQQLAPHCSRGSVVP